MLRTACLISLLLTANVAMAANPPKPGTFYTYSQVGVKKMEIKGSKINLTFKPTDEQFYWCPGAKVQVTKKATVVTFVRCKTSQNADITIKAKIGKRLIRTMTIPTNNKDVVVRVGPEKFKKIYASPANTTAKKPAAKKAPAKKPTGTSASKPTSRQFYNKFSLPGV